MLKIVENGTGRVGYIAGLETVDGWHEVTFNDGITEWLREAEFEIID